MAETKVATRMEWRTEPLSDLRGTEGYPDVDLAIIDGDRIVVGIVYEAGPKGMKRDSYSNYESNAKLIAAAPDLLTAAKAIEHWFSERNIQGGDAPKLLDQLRAAISKAQGE